MRNIDRIRQMSLEELAPLLVKGKDETRDFDNPCYSSPSDGRYWIENDTIDDCIEF